MTDAPQNPVYASQRTRETYGPMLDRLPEMAGFKPGDPALIIATQADLREQHGTLSTPGQVAAMSMTHLSNNYSSSAQRMLNHIGVPEGLVSEDTLQNSLPWLVTGFPGSVPSRSGRACMLILPDQPTPFIQQYPNYTWASAITNPTVAEILARNDPGYVPVHESRHCIQPVRMSAALSEFDSDGKGTENFPQVGAVNERIRLVGGVLDAAFRHVDGHETAYLQASPDKAQAEKDSVFVHNRLVGLVGADVAMRQNVGPEVLLHVLQEKIKDGKTQVSDLAPMQQAEAMLQGGADVRTVKAELDKLSPTTANEVLEGYGRTVGPSVLKDDPRAFAESLHQLHRQGGLANAGSDAQTSQSVDRLAALYLNSVADIHPEVGHLRIPLPEGVGLSPLPLDAQKAPPPRAMTAPSTGAGL